MSPSIADKTRVLRDEAWQGVMESDAFIAFKALDDAFVRMGGSSRIADDPHPIAALAGSVFRTAVRRMAENRKLSHAEAALAALRNEKMPLPTPQLLEASKEAGAEIGGADPLNNFRSTISKDDRFYSVKKNGTSYWWLKGDALPSEWNDSAGPSLLDEPAEPFVSSSQEGGDGDAPATT